MIEVFDRSRSQQELWDKRKTSYMKITHCSGRKRRRIAVPDEMWERVRGYRLGFKDVNMECENTQDAQKEKEVVALEKKRKSKRGIALNIEIEF